MNNKYAWPTPEIRELGMDLISAAMDQAVWTARLACAQAQWRVEDRALELAELERAIAQAEQARAQAVAAHAATHVRLHAGLDAWIENAGSVAGTSP